LEGSPQELSRMQMDLGPAVLAVLRPGMKPSAERPPEPEAFDLVLRARALRGYGLEDHFNRAVGLLNQAIQKDPRYGGAYAELASAYAGAATNSFVDPLGAAEKAEAAAVRAIQLDPSSATAYASEGYVDGMVLGKWKQGESEIRSALRLMPQDAAIHQRLGLLLLVQGQFQPALAEVRTAADLDPLVPAAGSSIGMVYFMERRYDRALAEWQKLAALHPDALALRALVGMAYEARAEYAKAQAEYRAIAAQDRVGSDLRMMHLLAVCGQIQQARDLLEKLAKTAPGGGLDFAATYAVLGDRDKAFEWLDRAWAKRSLWMLKVHPFLDPLRGDPRYGKLLKRAGFE
jgi:tetratricopeptide (TPR) repeat protein